MAEYAGSYIEHFANSYLKHLSWPLGGVQPIDFWYDLPYYGRIDERQNAVYVPDFVMGKRLDVLPTEENEFFALDFVAAAYGDLLNYMRKANATKRLAPESFFNKIEVQSGWQSADELYLNHTHTVFQTFGFYLKTTNSHSKITNFKDYVDIFYKFIVENGNGIPITRTGFITSRWCPPNISGLVIDLARGDHNDDDLRDKILGDPNLTFYKIAAQKHGFLVDKFAPWRLIADISSYPMQKYMVGEVGDAVIYDGDRRFNQRTSVDKNGAPLLKYKPGTATNLFKDWFKYAAWDSPSRQEGYYKKAYYTDIMEMYYNLSKYYNIYIKNVPYVKKKAALECGNRLAAQHSVTERTPGGWLLDDGGRAYYNHIRNIEFTREETQLFVIEPLLDVLNFSMYDLLKRYLVIRLSEEDIKMSNHKYKQLLLKLKKRSKSYFSGLRYINNKIKNMKPRGVTMLELNFILDRSPKSGILRPYDSDILDGGRGPTPGGGSSADGY